MLHDKYINLEPYYANSDGYTHNISKYNYHVGLFDISLKYRHKDYNYVQLKTLLLNIIQEEGLKIFDHIEMHDFAKEVVQRDDLVMFDILVQNGYPINGSRILMLACPDKFYEYEFCDPIDNTLSVAIINNYNDIFDYIISNKGIISTSHLSLCIEYNRYDMFVRLLNTNFVEDEMEDNLIVSCIMHEGNSLPYLKILLQTGYLPNIPGDVGGLNLLGFTFDNPQITYDALNILLQFGADPNNYDYKSEESYTLVSRILIQDYNEYLEKCVDLLLSYGADINIWNKPGENNNLKLIREKYPDVYTKYFTNKLEI